jgi:hypothetical protein
MKTCTPCNVTFSESNRTCPKCSGSNLSTITEADLKTVSGNRTEILESAKPVIKKKLTHAEVLKMAESVKF